MQISPALHRLGSPLVNAYLVEDRGEVTIIDAGLPGYWRLLPAELAAMGRTLDDVRAIVLTHGDTDHIGFAERLRRERGVPVYVHTADAARARGEVKKPSTGWGPIKLRALAGFLWYSGRHGGLRIPPVTELVTFDDGATLDLPGAPRVIHQPGHTPGSAVIHVPLVDAVFMGDTMTTRNVLTGEVGVPAGLAAPIMFTSSTGRGKMMVEFFSDAISVSVWRYRSVTAIGLVAITAAAWLSFSDASNSPLAWMILARFSRSASA